MGLFNFAREAGESIREALTGGGPDEDELKKALQKHGVTLQNLQLSVKGGTVSIGGVADSQAEREKAILIVGNVKGVDKVDDSIRVARPAAQAPDSINPTRAQAQTHAPAGVQTGAQAVEQSRPQPTEPESQFYTVKPGDTLSAIAAHFYGSASKYQAIFEANRPMLSDPDKIYPGQVLRIPQQH
jgi:nucleoid-associated protein YgaU